MKHTQDVVEIFIQKMKKSGIAPVHPQKIVADGRIHRYRTAADDGKAEATGWYVIHADGLPAGAFGCFRTGDKVKVKVGNARTLAEKSKLDVRFAQIRRDRNQLKQKWDAHKRKQVIRMWHAGAAWTPADTYLKNKGVRAHGIRGNGCTLLVPFRDKDGRLRCLQRIKPSGSKKYCGPKKGCYHMIGKNVRFRVAVAEGYATAATIHETLGLPVAMAGDSGNLKSVAKIVRDKYPLAEIYIAADNDWAQEQKSGTNIGLKFAREAAAAINGRVAIPIFDDRLAVESDSDFNDVLRLKGKEAIRRAFSNARTVAPPNGKEAFAMNLRTFLRLPTKQRKVLVAPWLREGGLVLVHAWRGVGKTLLRDALAAHLTTATDFLCWKIPRAASVLVVDGEMPTADVQTRIEEATDALGKKNVAPFRVITNDSLEDGPIDLRRPEWQELIEREGATAQVIFLDNVATLAGDTSDFNDTKSWMEIQRWMKKMRDKGQSIIWFHNDGKGGTQLGTATREIILDTVIQLTSRKGNKGGSSFRLKYSKHRWFWGKDSNPIDVTIESDGQGSHEWSWKPAIAGDAKEELREKVIELQEQGKSYREIERETKVPRSTAEKWVKKSKAD